MNTTVDISVPGMLAAYGLLAFPLALVLWLRLPLVRDVFISVARMSLQLLFVGFYLRFVFGLNQPLLNLTWLVVMVGVADLSVLRGCKLSIRRFGPALFCALLAGTAIPLAVVLGLALGSARGVDAQYLIPLGGMILGNCLRADVIGLRGFYDAIRKGQKTYRLSLAQGATLSEAVRPFFGDACSAALSPTIASIATIGLVHLPGMMTGVILGGASPVTAIKYQLVIMLAILAGTTITVAAAIRFTLPVAFTSYGVPDRDVLDASNR